MFKFVAKFGLATLVMLIAFTFMSGGKAAANPTGCAPSPDSTSQTPVIFGFNQGEQYDGYAGVTVTAYVGTDTDGNVPVNYHDPVNINFTLHAQLPSLPANANYINKTGNPDISYNDRIFKLNPKNPYGDPDSRTANHQFTTGSRTYDARSTSATAENGHYFQCNGLMAVGPGSQVPNYPFAEYGNRWGLDCGEAWVGTGSASGTSGTFSTKFWIDGTPTAPGAYWDIQSGGNTYRNGDMSYSNGAFTVTNGATHHIYLVYHPKAPQGTPSASCSKIDQYNYGNFSFYNDAGVLIKDRPTRTLVETENPGAVNNDTGGPIHAYAPGSGGSTDKSDQIWNITATAGSFKYYTTREYKQTNGNWSYIDNNGNRSSTATRNAHDVNDCYHATCNGVPGEAITVKGSDDPTDIVQANHQYTVSIPVWNDNTSGNAEPIPQSPGGYDFSLTEGPDDRQYGYVKNNIGTYLNLGEKTRVNVTFTAPNQIRDMTLKFYPDLWGSGSIGDTCEVHIRVYQQFNSHLGGQSTLKPNTEHPYQGDDYNTTINVSNDLSHDVNIPTSSLFYKKPAGGGQINLASNSNGGPFRSSPGGTWNTAWSGHYNIPAGSYAGGDEYCVSIHADYTTGYVGPDNNVVHSSTPSDYSNCPRIANEPYFKVLNSGISAGGDFDQRTDNGGLLAGYNDISDPAGTDRGASSQLSALALIKISGVASAQTPGNITRSPTDLTFANTGVQVDSTGGEKPVLGGEFGGKLQLTNETAPAGSALGASTTANLATGNYERNGDLTITGGNLPVNRNVTIFVKGNVYISNNITFNQSTGWDAGTAPSFILHATGKIYIKPSVTSLAGLYIAQKDSGGSGGKIYTCADSSGFAPLPAKNLYSCNNQLVVYGSFVADQVNLMRTFGSLRDEEPNPATPGGPGPTPHFLWKGCGTPGHGVGGEACPTQAQMDANNCININEPSEPSSSGWYDNQLCIDPASGVNLVWTYAGGVSNPNIPGYPYCARFNVADPDYWYDNWLCSDKNINLSVTTSPIGGRSCVRMYEIAESDAAWRSGYYLCATAAPGPPATPPTAHVASPCSNGGVQTVTSTCAAEVFEFSPQMYITSGGGTVCPAGGCGGPPQWQSLTSQPPVL